MDTALDVVVTEDEASSYALVIEVLARLSGETPGTICHASMHRLSGVARRQAPVSDSPLRLREAMLDLVQRGWELRRLATIRAEDDLDYEIAVAEELSRSSRARVHASVGDVGGHAAVMVEGRFVSLGLDDPYSGYVERALLVRQADEVKFWVRWFAQMFDDRRSTFVIAGPAGLDQSGIAELRRRVRGYARALGTSSEPVRLTMRQHQVAERLGRDPRPQLAEIARDLRISRDAVKNHCKKLYEIFGIPPGPDRLGPLVADMRRRGIV